MTLKKPPISTKTSKRIIKIKEVTDEFLINYIKQQIREAKESFHSYRRGILKVGTHSIDSLEGSWREFVSEEFNELETESKNRNLCIKELKSK